MKMKFLFALIVPLFFYLAFGMNFDTLSLMISTVVLSIGLIVFLYSNKYLEEDPNKSKFLVHVACTLSSVLVLLTSTNFLVLFLGWSGVSYFLHQLLVHFKENQEAKQAAIQKFWISRIGDIFLLVSIGLIYYVYKTVEFESFFKALEDKEILESNSKILGLAAVCLVLGAMTKSAQFPFHFWLPNTMLTPTPVSALMHAGVINAGGYLVLRMSPFLVKFPESLDILSLIGGLTAAFGVLIMMTQTDVKKSLAYSTIAQMGFMMLQCGLGAFTMATLHIVCHAYYKAYCFLSSGAVSDYGKLNRYFGSNDKNQSVFAQLLYPTVLTLSLYLVFNFLNLNLLNKHESIPLMIIFVLALSQILLSSSPSLLKIIYTIFIGFLYFILYFVFNLLLQNQFDQLEPEWHVFDVFISGFITAIFVLIYFIQNNLKRINTTKIGQHLYVKLFAGLNFKRI